MVAVQFTVAGKSGIYGFSNSTDKVVGGAGIKIKKKISQYDFKKVLETWILEIFLNSFTIKCNLILFALR